MGGIVVGVWFILVVILHVRWRRGVVVHRGGGGLVAGGVVLHHGVVLKSKLFKYSILH